MQKNDKKSQKNYKKKPNPVNPNFFKKSCAIKPKP